MLHREHPDRTFEPDDRHAGEAVEALLARLRTVDELGMAVGLGEVEDPALVGDRPDQSFPHLELGDVNGFLAQPVRREQFELVVAQQVNRADLALHRLGDEVDDPVELGLGVAARGHHIVEAG